jgi:hypothetical protein
MTTHETMSYTAFSAGKRLTKGALPEVVKTAKGMLERDSLEQVLIFDDGTGAQVDVDLHGPLVTILKHLPGYEAVAPARTGDSPAPRAGRPKLGVVPREVTLMPRHWEWLSAQPGGASVTLRKLVEAARRNDSHQGKQAQEACYRFMVAAAGNLPNFENATRALFAGDAAGFAEAIEAWPVDLREYALGLLNAGNAAAI